MNIYGISGTVPGALTPGEINRPRTEPNRPDRADDAAARQVDVQTQPQTRTQPPAQAASAAAPLGTAPAPASLPVAPPPGTDPELWSVLSSEERVFFAKVGAMGPLTYGRLTSELNAPPPIARGGRLNVKA